MSAATGLELALRIMSYKVIKMIKWDEE